MAYETGTAASHAALATAFSTFLVANGWTLTGSVLHKGAIYATLAADTPNLRLILRAGTGESAGVLTGSGPGDVYVGTPITPDAFVFPVTYHFHAHGDEAYGVVNWSTDFCASFGLGCSPAAGVPGTGNWYFGTYAGTKGDLVSYNTAQFFYEADVTSGTRNTPGPFWGRAGTVARCNSFVHHALDGGAWSGAGGAAGFGTAGASAQATHVAGALLIRTPNAWNAQSTLIPCQVQVGRASAKISLVAELAHMRYVAMQNHAPGEIITLGTDQWQVFPFYKKGAAWAPGATGRDSGFLGIALRYDGP